MKGRIVLGMSGGLDSSVSAHILQKQGYEVIGITMKFTDASRCCSEVDAYNGQKVAQKLGIEHYTVDVARQFEKYVVEYFLREYSKGRTPNPCAVCNREVKFPILLKKAKEFSATHIASGHYARIERDHSTSLLLKGADEKKDQSYFLGRLKKEWLPLIIFPVGGLTKKEVRLISGEIGLPFFEKKESQEVCFIEGNDYRKYLLSKLPTLNRPGNIVDKEGKILGNHKGLFYYTIGQRKGIQVNINKPLYVTHIDTHKNTITVGNKDDAFRSKFFLEDINLLVPQERIPEYLFIKIRSQHLAAESRLKLSRKKGIVEFAEPQLAVTPGQLAVFYENNTILGSGWIINATSLE
jgi:tRNA-specific 2-thiouridylase